MTLLPTLREKRRYVYFEVVSEVKFKKAEIEGAIFDSIVNLFGEHGFSLMNPKLMDFDENEQIGVIKCARAEAQRVKASLALVNKIGEMQAAIHVKGISGTLKKLRNKYLNVKDK